MRRLLLMAVLLMPLAACAPATSDRPADGPPPVRERVDGRTLIRGMLNLPGAEVLVEGGVPDIRYREASLYKPGAVLPRYRSLIVLDALAERLKKFSGNRWQVRVRAESPAGAEYAERLARARAELLRRYFERAGAGALMAEWKTEIGAGPVLELVPQPVSPESSSGVKR